MSSKKEIVNVLSKIYQLAEALAPVCSTLGPKGNTVLLDKYGTTKATKDGISVLKALEMEDNSVQMLLSVIKNEIDNIAKTVGDGTTTATVFIREILIESEKLIKMNVNSRNLMLGIEKASKEALNILPYFVRRIDNNKEEQIEFMKRIGTIAANGDKEVGEILTQAINKVGKYGTVNIDVSNSSNTIVKYTEGMSLDRGYSSISREFFKRKNMDKEKYSDEITIEKPFILIWEKKITNLQPFISVLEKISKSSAPLLIITDGIENLALRSLIINNEQGLLNSVAVSLPSFGQKRKNIIQDLAILTNAKVFDDATGLTDEIQMEHLGSADMIKVTSTETIIIGGHGKKENIEQRTNDLKAQYDNIKDDVKSSYEKDEIQERLAKMTGGICLIKAGGYSELEMYEKKDRIEDALYAIKAAQEKGFAPGGGISFFLIGKMLKKKLNNGEFNHWNEDERKGCEVFINAALSILNSILENCSSISKDVITNKIEVFFENKSLSDIQNIMEKHKVNDNNKEINFLGFNAASGQMVDILNDGIIDPVSVIEIVLQKCFSVPALIINSCYILANIKNNDTGNNMMNYPM